MNKLILFLICSAASVICSAQSPQLLLDINPGTGKSNAGSFQVLGDFALFTAYNLASGRELWRTDGTSEGTYLVKDITSGSTSSIDDNFFEPFVYNGRLFFSAKTTYGGFELWVSDGTDAGTQCVKDIYPGPNSAYPYALSSFKDLIFFVAEDGNTGYELWRTDGNEAGTSLFMNVSAGYTNGFGSPTQLHVYNNSLYFSANGSNGQELWKSDGSVPGTAVLKDVNQGSSSSPSEFIEYNGILYFVATGNQVKEIYRTDGTADNTFRVSPVFGGGPSNPKELTLFKDKLFFSGTSNNNEVELWSSNGTQVGTTRFKDINPGGYAANSSSPENLKVFNNKLFFQATDTTYGSELWFSDGTVEGTELFLDVKPQKDNKLYDLSYLQAGNSLFILASDSILYKTDGTIQGTELLDFDAIGLHKSSLLGYFNGNLFIRGKSNSMGDEIYTLKVDPNSVTESQASDKPFFNGNALQFSGLLKSIEVFSASGQLLHHSTNESSVFEFSTELKGFLIVRYILDNGHVGNYGLVR